jgi:hypothetical protein
MIITALSFYRNRLANLRRFKKLATNIFIQENVYQDKKLIGLVLFMGTENKVIRNSTTLFKAGRQKLVKQKMI